MEQLPQELIVHIVSFLEFRDVISLNLISRKFLEISRDTELWKQLCFPDSHTSSRSFRHREGRYGGPPPIQDSNIFTLHGASWRTPTRSPSRWDGNSWVPPVEPVGGTGDRFLPHPSENIDWYHEYIARHAPLSMSWLSSAPCTSVAGSEVRGMGLFKNAGKDVLITPMGDGSVCLWDMAHDVDRPTQRAGRVTSRRNWEALLGYGRLGSSSNYNQNFDAVECVSVDQSNGKAYFAMRSTVTEVDLNTMIVSDEKRFANPICCLSSGGAHPDPLTVGTSQSIQIYDPRDSSLRTSSSSSLTHGNSSAGPARHDSFSDFHCPYSEDDNTFAIDEDSMSIKRLPLSISHLSHDIYVGGRFPSILSYDRRFFPQRMTSFYSGARISALATTKSQNNIKDTIVAAGEYRGKGSLELYTLSNNSASRPFSSTEVPLKNRTSASRSKLLSVIPHGTRLLFSDLDGQLKWVERNGSTLVRRWNINNWSVRSSSEARGNIFNASPDDGDVARKLLSLDEGERSDILVWTGEKVGVVGYGNTGRSAKDAKETDVERASEDEEGSSENEERYGRMMRRALERQADEVRFVRGLGLGR